MSAPEDVVRIQVVSGPDAAGACRFLIVRRDEQGFPVSSAFDGTAEELDEALRANAYRLPGLTVVSVGEKPGMFTPDEVRRFVDVGLALVLFAAALVAVIVFGRS